MFEKAFNLFNMSFSYLEQGISSKTNLLILLNKRFKGHSKWANIKHTKLLEDSKRNLLIQKSCSQIIFAIKQYKNSNPNLNQHLKNAISEAKRNNVPNATIEKTIKNAGMALDGNMKHVFCFRSPIGILFVAEFFGHQGKSLKERALGVVKKFGFELVLHPQDEFITVGIIIAKHGECDKSYNEVLEDALETSIEEVNEVGNKFYEFRCNPNELIHNTEKLKNLGYVFDHCNVEYIFSDNLKINDSEVLKGLEKMEEKLNFLDGFSRIVYNLE